jgi:hypothetical protein
MQDKKCSRCKRTKNVDEFYKRVASKDGLEARCKECSKAQHSMWLSLNRDTANEARRKWHKEKGNEWHRNWRQNNPDKVISTKLKSAYGISLKEYNDLFAFQNGKCAICPSTGDSKRLCVDHDHSTGKVRGLLCNNCNRGLGLLGDSPSVLQSALLYLSSAGVVEYV